MPLTPEQLDWLREQERELKRELDELLSGKVSPGYADKNERRLELIEELDDVQRQLRDDE